MANYLISGATGFVGSVLTRSLEADGHRVHRLTRRRNGRFVEIVGHYDPLTKPAGIRLDADRIKHWLSCGAQPSDTVRSFIRKEKIA